MSPAETGTSQKGGQCHHEHQKLAVFAAVGTLQQTHLAIVKITKVKAGNPTSQVNRASSVDMEQSGKSYGRGYLSATKGCVRTIFGRES